MSTVKIVLDQRRAKKDGTFPVVIRVRYLKKFFDLQTNLSVYQLQFDNRKQQIIGNNEANFHIEEMKERYSKRVREFLKEHTNSTFDIAILKRYVQQKPRELVTVEEFWEEIIQQLIDTKRIGSARSYRTTLSVFSKVIDCKMTFKQVLYKDLVNIETTLLKRGVSVNGLAVYMRTFRAVCNKAILYNYVDYEWYPFRKYKIKKEKTTPRVIGLEEMRKYFKLEMQESEPMYKYWCIGKLIFMLRGINLTDLLALKKASITEDRIIYKRAKTGKMYSVKILPEVLELFKHFSDDSNSVLGFADSFNKKRSTAELNQHNDYRKRVNKKLKKIGEMLEFDEPLTTYVFRYTYANIAKQLGYSKDLIAEALGHEYGNSVTGIYLEMFDNDVVDAMNEAINNKVL